MKKSVFSSFFSDSKICACFARINYTIGVASLDCLLGFIGPMPFGLLSYNIRYFVLDAVNKVKADPDYIQRESTMFSNFGHKWVCLQRGPGFAYGALEEEHVSEESSEAEVHGTNTVTGDSSGGILQQAWQEVFGDDGYTSLDTALDPFDASNQEPLNVNLLM